jgi:hypothetical protein
VRALGGIDPSDEKPRAMAAIERYLALVGCAARRVTKLKQVPFSSLATGRVIKEDDVDIDRRPLHEDTLVGMTGARSYRSPAAGSGYRTSRLPLERI